MFISSCWTRKGSPSSATNVVLVLVLLVVTCYQIFNMLDFRLTTMIKTNTLATMSTLSHHRSQKQNRRILLKDELARNLSLAIASTNCCNRSVP